MGTPSQGQGFPRTEVGCVGLGLCLPPQRGPEDPGKPQRDGPAGRLCGVLVLPVCLLSPGGFPQNNPKWTATTHSPSFLRARHGCSPQMPLPLPLPLGAQIRLER